MSSIWKTLGIARTTDRDEIRRAYAKRLKLTNPEDDAEGFQRLRQAYEAALEQARYAEWNEVEVLGDDEDEDDEAQPQHGDTATPAAPEAPEPQLQPSGGGGAVHIDPLVNHQIVCSRFAVLLADSAETGELRSALDDVLRSEALNDLSTYHRTELWLADCLVAAGNTADPLLDRAITFFDWRGASRRFDTPDEIQRVLERQAALGSLAEFERRTHPRHKAYELLKQSPATFTPWQRATLGLRAGEIRSFLTWLETDRPGLRAAFDPETLDWWHGYFSRKRRPILRWVIFVVVIVALNVGFRSLDRLFFPREDRIEVRAREEPDNPGAQADLCRLRSRLNFPPGVGISYDEAVATCDRALALNPQSLTALDGRALLLNRGRKWQAARDDYERILKLSPHDARALFGRGWARTQMDDLGGVEDIAMAKAGDPEVHEIMALQLELRANVFDIAPAPRRPQDREPPQFTIRVPEGSTLSQPEWITKPPPRPHPTFAQRADKSGKATLRCAISREGLARDCVVWSEEPQNFGFGEAALGLVREARFKPGAIDGEPIDGAPLMIPFSFRIDEKVD